MPPCARVAPAFQQSVDPPPVGAQQTAHAVSLPRRPARLACCAKFQSLQRQQSPIA